MARITNTMLKDQIFSLESKLADTQRMLRGTMERAGILDKTNESLKMDNEHLKNVVGRLSLDLEKARGE